MPTDERTKPSDSGDSEKTPKTRIRKFPIRQFSNLLDEFLQSEYIGEVETVAELKTAVDQALLAYYKS
jgi:hypothetical protein